MSFESPDVQETLPLVPDIGGEGIDIMLYSSVGLTAIGWTLLSFFITYPLFLIKKLRG